MASVPKKLRVSTILLGEIVPLVALLGLVSTPVWGSPTQVDPGMRSRADEAEGRLFSWDSGSPAPVGLSPVVGARHEDPNALSGACLRIGGLIPRQYHYGSTSGGMTLDVSYWFEQSRWAIEPRLGVHFDTDTSENSFLEVPLDVGGFFILSRTWAAPYIGGGGGMRFIDEVREFHVRTGTILVTEAVNNVRDRALGGSLYARAGLLLGRSESFRINVNVDYNITFVRLNKHDNPQALSFGVGVIF